MHDPIEDARLVLAEFAIKLAAGGSPVIDRREVVAHATLSALVAHWPSRATAEIQRLIERCAKIRKAESSRWVKQRRIALAKLATEFAADAAAGVPAEISREDWAELNIEPEEVDS